MVRRCVDVASASLALLVLSPLLGVLALVIRGQLGSPVLFAQARSGRGGAVFTIYKFRTMRPADYDDEPDADRTPRLGRLLRGLSLDELPQLWNVVRGDMSLIGPRPTLPEQVAHYSARQRRRLEVRPGMTGYAQVRGRNELSWPERIELDIWYLDHRSLRLEAWIVWTTVVKLLRRDGITGEGGVNLGFPIPRSGSER